MIRKTLFLFLIFSLLTPILLAQPVVAAVGAGDAPATLRIGVINNGIHRITPADLLAAGLDPAAHDPRQFALSSQSQPVAILVSGEDDGSFDEGDELLFFGEKFEGTEMEEKYTDENVYWLDLDPSSGSPGPRISTIDGAPTGALTPPADFAASVRAEESKIWYTQHRLDPPTQDTWFWDELKPVVAGRGITRTYESEVPFPAATGDFLLSVDLNARVENLSVSPDHRSTIAMNGVALRDETWDGKRREVFTATVPAENVIHGLNAVSIGAINPANVASNWIYVNWWQLEYRRLFHAWQGQLDFSVETAGPQEYSSEGWASTAVEVWEITDVRVPQRLEGLEFTAAAGSFDLRFGADGQPQAHFWLQEKETIATPVSIKRHFPSDLRNPTSGHDVVIITSAELRPAAERLAAWQGTQGHQSLVVDFADAVDEFNHGIYNPQAVPNLLAWASSHWPDPKPAYLVLFGDGHWNFKAFNTAKYPDEANHIPPFLAWADPWQGEVPADNRYADIDGDVRPDLAVGRIAVNTLAEAHVVIDKLEAYDSNVRAALWQRTALFVADNADNAGDFAAVSDEIIAEHLPADLSAQRIYLNKTTPDAASARAAIVAALEGGVWLMQYAGHGSPSGWANEDIWGVNDIPALQNAAKLPVVMTFNCLDGYFAYPGNPSLAEIMNRQAGGGSIAAISPSGLGTTDIQHEFRKLLMDVMFQEEVQDLGQALLTTKQQFYERFGPHYLIETVTLFGDPTLQIPDGLNWNHLPLQRR